MTVRDALRHGIAVLAAAGVDNPALDARLLLAHAMGLDQAGLLRDRDVLAPMEAYQTLLDRRALREPVALILGRQEFWSLAFAVSPATLIPRPDSETLIEAAIAVRRDRKAVRRVLDLGTGTGCLLLAALTEFPGAWGMGVDLSPDAAALASRNARALGLDGRASFVCADWDTAFAVPSCCAFDVILSNPPYIASAEIAQLMPDVARFEPGLALDGGADGLVGYRALLDAVRPLMAFDGVVIFELGAGQAGPVQDMAWKVGLRTEVRADLGGVERALVMHVDHSRVYS